LVAIISRFNNRRAAAAQQGRIGTVMWLLPVFNRISSLALRGFYRVRMAGVRVPASGPVLLVANHPNSLMDPAAVAAAAGRPVRFLAKAPLFTHSSVGWLIRGSGAIPVYRPSDDPGDPAITGRNVDTFRAAHEALAAGDAIGIFPEGLSHSEPSLGPLKTGAARLALGAAPLAGIAFPIIPVGFSFREKERFRSEALGVIGAPIEWSDLAGAGDEPGAVRELTARIDAGLRQVTVNLERWEDAPLVETAEEIYAAEYALDGDPARRVERLAQVGTALSRIRSAGNGDWRRLAEDVGRHDRLLRRVGLRPGQLDSPPAGAVARWAFRQLGLLLVAPAAIAGAIIYWVPFRLTGVLDARSGSNRDLRATYKALVGTVLHLGWTLVLCLLVLAFRGWLIAFGTAIVLPLLGMTAVLAFEQLHRSEGEARRFAIRLRRSGFLARLRTEQRELTRRLEEARAELSAPLTSTFDQNPHG
jgi:1-acyl-sn-glycerol-3-phosphate acyltransferase